MRIPTNEKIGFPTVSASQLRTYGAGGFRLGEQEEAKGCPRQYKAKYVERRVPDQRGYALRYGSYWHEVMYRMERDDLSPDEALLACLPIDAGPEMLAEGKADMAAYLERGTSPSDLYGTLAVEADMAAELYVDEDFGPIWYRGIMDWIGIDMDVPTVVHVADYKTNRHPPTLSDVLGDVQLKGYAWLALNAPEMPVKPRTVVVHLDAVKYRDVEVMFSAEEIEDWRDWAIALCRKILRDEEGKPILNPGCSWCPVKNDCPAFQVLPEVGDELAGKIGTLDDPQTRLQWRDAANKVRLLLANAVTEIDDGFKEQALEQGLLTVGTTQWSLEAGWEDVWDLRSLHGAMGDEFYDVVSTSKTAVTRATKSWPPDRLAGVNAARSRQPSGTKVVKKQIKEAGEGD
jgi:hypothetical protein